MGYVAVADIEAPMKEALLKGLMSTMKFVKEGVKKGNRDAYIANSYG